MKCSAKIFLFNMLMIVTFNAFAGQPTWQAPSEEVIARTAFQDMQMYVSNVIVDDLDDPFAGRLPNQKELFFDLQGVTYNCVITFSERVFFNPEMNGYSVGRIDISECENYANRESANPVTFDMRRRSALFREGVIFLEDNRSFVVSPYHRMLRNMSRR